MFSQIWSVIRRTSTRNKVLFVLGAAALVVGVSVVTKNSDTVTDSVKENQPVQVAAVSSLTSTGGFTAVGSVEAVSEVDLKAERGGQVTAVYAELGASVRAGSVLVQLENSAERAALIQAQGSYDAAVAGAAQGESGVRSAEIAVTTAEEALSTAVRNSYTTLNSTLLTTIDLFFSNPTSQIPGLRISGDTAFLNTERVGFQTSLPQLQQSLTSLSPATNDAASLGARTTAARMVVVIDSLQSTVTKDSTETMSGKTLGSYTADLVAARAALVALISGLENAERATQSAAESLAQARLGGSTADSSVANAQIKIALGALRSAQANYEKTTVRTPISGVVNSLTVKRGDYVSPLQDVALVSSNNGLQITTAISESDRERITVGDTVRIEGTATGTVAAIGGAVDPKTGKVAVKVSIESDTTLTNGTTVTIDFAPSAQAEVSPTLVVPLTAIKLTADSAYVFTVENNVLVSQTVVLGPVTGDSVVVESGITADTQIVLDARGRKTGETVTVETK